MLNLAAENSQAKNLVGVLGDLGSWMIRNEQPVLWFYFILFGYLFLISPQSALLKKCNKNEWLKMK